MERNNDVVTKLYLTKLNRLEQNRIKVKEQKHNCLKTQKYEAACKLRDEEKDIVDLIERLKKMMKINGMITNK